METSFFGSSDVPHQFSPHCGHTDIQMELASIFTEPTLRRCWLLNKALEDASLEQALRLALAADAFLGASQPPAKNGHDFNLKEWPLGDTLLAQPAPGLPTIPSASDRANDKWILPSFEPGAGAASATELVVALADSFEDAGVAEDDPDEEAAHECSGEEAEDEPAACSPEASMTSDLAVLAGIEDIIRYLRQQDDVVVSAGTGTHLVNGRFHLNSDELLARANKIRHRQGKPLFQRIPSGFPTPNGGAAAERMQERA